MTRLPKPERNIGPLIGPDVESFTVGSWCSSLDGSGQPTAVGISVRIDGIDLVIRLKTPERVDQIVQALLRHKRDVWPEAR